MGKFFSDEFESRVDEIYSSMGLADQYPDVDDVLNVECLGNDHDIAATAIALFSAFHQVTPSAMFSQWRKDKPEFHPNPLDIVAVTWLQGIVCSARCEYEAAVNEKSHGLVNDNGQIVFDSIEDFEDFLNSVDYGFTP